MTFRRGPNLHDLWLEWVGEHHALLAAIPPEARNTQAAFRDYVTSGAHRGQRFTPSIDELSREEFEALTRFILYKTEFDLEVQGFDAFNARLRVG